MGRRRVSPMRPSSPVSTKPATIPSHQANAVAAPVPQQPGLFAQMAATAGGVAVGSAIGHTVGHALTGAFTGDSGSRTEMPASVQNQQQLAQKNDLESPCQNEMKQFLNCTQEQSDISLCEGFNFILKECRAKYGSPQIL